MSEEKKATFEEELAALENIVRHLEGEDVPLEEAINFYERGVKLSASLNKTLDKAQRRIEALTFNQKGEPQIEPFGDDQA